MRSISRILLVLLGLGGGWANASTPQPGFQAEFEVSSSASADKAYRKLEVLSTSLAKENLTVKSSEVTAQETKVAQIEMSDDEVSNADAVRHCPELGGQVESVTVPAGTFESCKMTVTDGAVKTEIWESTVPFIAVKAVRTLANGTVETRLLTGYGVR